MARELGITQKSAWFLAQRICETWMANRGDKLDGQVQVDETYIGGKETNKHANKKLNAGRGSVGKIAVAGIRDDKGEVRANVVPNNKSVTLQNFVETHTESGATVVTDTHGGYVGLERAGYAHVRINHSVGEYVRDMAHTNDIESFWALLKRGYNGIYHFMSAKHLDRYIKEFSFRHKTAKISTMDFINLTIGRMAHKRLTYKELVRA